MSSVNRRVNNPRMRSASRTIVPADEMDDPLEQDYLWNKPNTSQNRSVVPVLKNEEGSLLSDRWALFQENPFAPWW